MPIYEYECDDCAYHFEIKQGFNDPPEASCPRCQGKTHRIFNPAIVIFKGSGFYVTDNRAGSGEKSETGHEEPVKSK
ncbi:MAG: FmdB family zinc ribbon protein [Chloroflexota bacterium]